MIWLLALAGIATATLLLPTSDRNGLSVLSAAVFAFATWMALTNAWNNLSYTAGATYHAAFLVGGFIVGRRAGAASVRLLFYPAIGMAAALAGWGLWQLSLGEARAHALFETPATLAAVINLVLLPCLVLVARFPRNVWLLFGSLVLSAGMAATASRGGWLALVVSLLITFALARRLGIRVDFKATVLVLGIIFVGWFLSGLVPLALQYAATLSGNALVPSGAPPHSMIGQGASHSSLERMGLYALAVQGISAVQWLTGYGYLSFFYLMEAGRDSIGSFDDSTTYFAHNDFLQILLELGIPGLAGFVSIVAIPLAWALWRLPGAAVSPFDKIVALSGIAAMASMATHALVDFPFYIPVCLSIYGAILGVVESIFVRRGLVNVWHLATSSAKRQVQRAVAVAGATFGAWILVMPVAAELAAGHANRRWLAADAQGAAFWFEAARRIEPRDWRYHWYAGEFWFAQAVQHRKPEAAQLADRAFAEGDAANPRQVRNLVGRIATHRRLPALLARPADGATLGAWADRAIRLAPLDAAARAEHRIVHEQKNRRGGA